MSSWAEKLAAKDYKVTSNEEATNYNYLESTVDFLKQMDIIIQNGKNNGIFDDEEFAKLQEAMLLMKSAHVPQSLLTRDIELDRMKTLSGMLKKR